MTMDIIALMEGLSRNRPIFHSEADFQHALAWRIHKIAPGAEVRLEHKPLLHERVYLDVWIPTSRIALELKYLTRKLMANRSGESFALRDHAAQDIGRYDFLKDVQRLERVVLLSDLATVGFAVCLTNDSAYWKVPTHKDTVDAAFRLHEGRTAKGELKWSERAGAGTIKGREAAIKLRDSYKMTWRDFSEVGAGGYKRFRYLALEVKAS
jgi:hypothetical protein